MSGARRIYGGDEKSIHFLKRRLRRRTTIK